MHAIICNSDDIGKLILRVSVASFVLVHGISKIIDPAQLDFVADLFISIGLSGYVAYLVYVGEVLAPLLMIVGWRTKIAAALVTTNMVVVLLVGHTSEIFPLSEFRWWGIETQTSFLLGALAVSFLGAGRYALSLRSQWD